MKNVDKEKSRMKKWEKRREEIDIDSLYTNLICALTHNLDVCTRCNKCERLKLITDLAAYFNKPVPWTPSDKWK